MTKSIMFIGDTIPAWWESLKSQQDSYTFTEHTTRQGVISTLVDIRPAVILIDGDGDLFWCTAPKSNPATRRLPLFAIGHTTNALRAGADLILSPTELLKDAPNLLQNFIREVDTEQLACDCARPLPALAQQGIEQFNKGEYYKQHDSFEALWVNTDSPVRDLYRAILQVGVAYYQITRGNYRGAYKMLLRSVQWLTVLPDVCQGIDVAALRADSAQVRAALDALSQDEITQFDKTLLQPIKLVKTSG